MAQGSLHWLYTAIALTLSAAAVLVIAWALFWDRARGRKRCPRCWYDMATGTLTCPECGRMARSEATLLRTRRRWGWVAVGLMLLVAAQSVRMTPRAIARGARGLIPTFVLARWWPMDVDGWLRSGSLAPQTWSRDPIIEEWFARWEEGIGVADSAAWLERVGSRIRALQDSADLAAPVPSTFAIYDLRSIRSDVAPVLNLDRQPPRFGFLEARACMMAFAAPDAWFDHGGSSADLFDLSSGMIVRAPSDVHHEVGVLLGSLESTSQRGCDGADQASWEPTLSVWRRLDRARIPPIRPEHTTADILRAVSTASGIKCEAMSSGYFRGMIGYDEPRGLEQPESSAAAVLDGLLSTLRETTDATNCAWIIRDGAIKLVSTDEQAATPQLRVFNVTDRVALLPLSGRAAAVERFAAQIRARCSPESWAEHGGEWRLAAFADRIIVRAPLPLICKVALYLERTAGDPVTPTPAAPADAGPPAD
jgi:hypothetical protein